MFDFRRITLFCFGYHLSKRKMTIYAKHFGGSWPPGPSPGYAYEYKYNYATHVRLVMHALSR